MYENKKLENEKLEKLEIVFQFSQHARNVCGDTGFSPIQKMLVLIE